MERVFFCFLKLRLERVKCVSKYERKMSCLDCFNLNYLLTWYKINKIKCKNVPTTFWFFKSTPEKKKYIFLSYCFKTSKRGWSTALKNIFPKPNNLKLGKVIKWIMIKGGKVWVLNCVWLVPTYDLWVC